jgi:micrococcal nuclease
MYTYQIEIKRWIDGDTVDADVDLGFNVKINVRFRLLDVDTPERTQPLYKEARICSESVYPVGSKIIVNSIKGTDKYGRWLIDLPLVKEALINAKLLKVNNASS